jgi:hypothetical protein
MVAAAATIERGVRVTDAAFFGQVDYDEGRCRTGMDRA